MPRLMTIAFVALSPLLLPAVASAQRVDINQIYSVSRQLHQEVHGFSAVAHAQLRGQRNFGDLCDELDDLEDDLRDLDRSIRDAAYRPEKLDKLARRAAEVDRAVHKVCDELEDVLRVTHARQYSADGQGNTRPVFRPDLEMGGTVPFGRPAFYPANQGVGLSVQIGQGRPNVRIVTGRQVVNRSVVVPDPCDELRARVITMESLSGQLVALTRHCL